MDYPQTLAYLHARLPMFTRVGAVALKKGLYNTFELCKRLGNPEQKFQSIHIGGTNGKGSTSHMLAAILQTAGYKTGLYTSPHLLDFRERIKVNGEMISKADVVDFIKSQKDTIEEIEPSFFEATVAMAFDQFAKQKVDIAIIEVGLGGRLDSTNVITPLLSIITNISYDHMNILGNTLPEIATEKAGIIKKGIPIIIGQKQDGVADIFNSKAEEMGSNIEFAPEKYPVSNIKYPVENHPYLEVEIIDRGNFELDLTGTYQAKNLPAVLAAVQELNKQGFKITCEHVTAALKRVKNLTGLMGRWQTLSTDPLVICDTGHNEDGISEVVKNISETPHKKLHMVIGMVKDKDISKILGLLPTSATYYFCQPDIERAKPVQDLRAEASALQLYGNAFGSVKEAFEMAKASAKDDDLVFVGGSTFVVAEVLG